MEGVTAATKRLLDFVKRTDAVTQECGTPYILVTTVRQPNMFIIVHESVMALNHEPLHVLHSGRTPVEV